MLPCNLADATSHFQVTASSPVSQRPSTFPLVFPHSFPFRFSTSPSVSPFPDTPSPKYKRPAFRKGPLSNEGWRDPGDRRARVSHDPPSSPSPRRRRKTRPLRQQSGRRCLQRPRVQGWGAQIHPADEYFTWGEGGARGSVEDFMRSLERQLSTWDESRKFKGKDRPRATSTQKEKIPDPKRRSPDFLGRRAGSWHVRSLATPTP